MIANAVLVFARRSHAQPFATNISLVSIPIGLLATVLGPPVSRAFEIVYHRPELVYIWGVVLLCGGINVAIGVYHRVPSIERAGLYVLAVPWMFYGVSVIVGLHFGGLVTGPLSIVVALSCVQRARFILTDARRLVDDAAAAEAWAADTLAGPADE